MIVVFASGNGSNFESLVRALPDQKFHLVCNLSNAPVLQRAKILNVTSTCVDHTKFPDRASHESEVHNQIKLMSVKLIVLAGYMRVLSPRFFQLFSKTQIINLHPAPPTLYKGADGYTAAVKSKRPFWQVSVHTVIPELDAGPVIAASTFAVFPYETAQTLAARIKPIEHTILQKTVVQILGDRNVAI